MQNISRFLTTSFCVALSLTVLSCQSSGGGQPASRTADEAATKTPAGPSVAELRAKLKDPDMSVRLAAVEQLGPHVPRSQEAVDAPRAVGAALAAARPRGSSRDGILEALADSAPLVRRFAAPYGLSEVKSPSPPMLMALAKLLRDPELSEHKRGHRSCDGRRSNHAEVACRGSETDP